MFRKKRTPKGQGHNEKHIPFPVITRLTSKFQCYNANKNVKSKKCRRVRAQCRHLATHQRWHRHFHEASTSTPSTSKRTKQNVVQHRFQSSLRSSGATSPLSTKGGYIISHSVLSKPAAESESPGNENVVAPLPDVASFTHFDFLRGGSRSTDFWRRGPFGGATPSRCLWLPELGLDPRTRNRPSARGCANGLEIAVTPPSPPVESLKAPQLTQHKRSWTYC
jgi:hypothetical protein